MFHLICLMSIVEAQVNWILYNTSNSDLPSNEIGPIVFDSSGDAWIGTTAGLTTFDGLNWTTFNTSNSGLISNSVSCIAIDEDGILWIGTGAGLNKFDGNNWAIYIPAYFDITSIVFDSSGTMWIGSLSLGLVEYDGINWTYHNTSNSGLPSNRITCIAVDANNTKWIGTATGGLVTLIDTNWSVYNTSNSGLPNNYIRSVACDENNTKWIGTFDGLVKFDGINWTTYNTLNSGLPDDQIIDIAIDGNGIKWITIPYLPFNPGKLVRFDGISWTIFSPYNSPLPCNLMGDVAIDSNGSKWISTCGIMVYNEGGIPQSINDLSDNNELHLRPNPAHDFSVVELPAGYHISRIEIFNSQGNLIDSQNVENRSPLTLDVSNWPAGIYLFGIQTDKVFIATKLVKD